MGGRSRWGRGDEGESHPEPPPPVLMRCGPAGSIIPGSNGPVPGGAEVASVSTDHVDTLRDKEHTMHRSWVPTALLTFVLSLSRGSLALASRDHPESVLPRVVATVLSLDPRGPATI